MKTRTLAAGLLGAVTAVVLLLARCALEPDAVPPPRAPSAPPAKAPRVAEPASPEATRAPAALPIDPQARTVLVTDLADAPIADARVTFVPETAAGDPPARLELAPTDAAGRAPWPSSAFPGRGVLVVDANWYETADRPVREHADVRFRLRQKIRVDGTVRSTEGAPLTAARVEVRAVDLRPGTDPAAAPRAPHAYRAAPETSESALTDAWGNFLVQAPIAEWLEVVVTAAGHGGSRRVVAGADARRLEFVLPVVAARRLVVRETPVPDAAGVAPLSEATSVRVFERRASALGALGTVRRAPLRELTRLEPGVFDASGVDDGLHEIYVVLAGCAVVPVQANWGGGVEEAVVELPRGYAYAALAVTGGSSFAHPIASARGWIAPGSMSPADAWSVVDAAALEGAPCDSGGAFRAEGAWRDATATFLAAADGFERGSSRGSVEQAGSRSPVRVVLFPSVVSDVPLRVVGGEDGRALAGVPVRWGGAVVWTGADGRAVCAGVPAGTQARVDADGRVPRGVLLTLPPETKELVVELSRAARVVARVADVTGRGLPGIPVSLAGGAEPESPRLAQATSDGNGLVVFVAAQRTSCVVLPDSETWIAEPCAAGPRCVELTTSVRPRGKVEIRMDLGNARVVQPTLVLTGPGAVRREIKLVDKPILVADLAPGPWSAALSTAMRDGTALLAELPDLRVVSDVTTQFAFVVPERWTDAIRLLPLVDGVVTAGAWARQEQGGSEWTKSGPDGVLTFGKQSRRGRVLVIDGLRRRAALTAPLEPGPGVVKVDLVGTGSLLVPARSDVRVAMRGGSGGWFDLSPTAFSRDDELCELLLPVGLWSVRVNGTATEIQVEAGRQHTLR